MSIRGPTGKFFYDRVHDVFLYFLVLEHHIYDEAKGDFQYTRSGEIAIRGGWSGIAREMTNVFKVGAKGRPFTPSSVQQRYELFMSQNDDKTSKLFNEVMDFRDGWERIRQVMDA
jgi:hypothetical protein